MKYLEEDIEEKRCKWRFHTEEGDRVYTLYYIFDDGEDEGGKIYDYEWDFVDYPRNIKSSYRK